MNSVSKLLGAISCLFVVSIVTAQPVIVGFAPASGQPGTIVTISGSNFSTMPADNIVMFGAVRATVNSATISSTTVTVPTGASYQPITVSVNNLTAASKTPFRKTFTGNATPFYSRSFELGKSQTTEAYTSGIKSADLNGDGKIDLVTTNETNNLVTVLANTNYNGGVDSFVISTLSCIGAPHALMIKDVNGDGKQELIVFSRNSPNAYLSVYPNTSSGASISFGTRIDLSFADVDIPTIDVADIDGDGRPDILGGNNTFSPGNGRFSVFKNTSSGSSISFAAKTDFTFSYEGGDLRAADIDNDGKIDVVITGKESKMTVLRNTSSAGTISFASALVFNTPAQSWHMDVGDLDNDGRTDVAITIMNGMNYVCVFRNTSIAGNISFDTRKDLPTGSQPEGIALSDLDGDGITDIAVVNMIGKSVSVLKNSSTPGNISFADRVDFATNANRMIIADDINGDGKPELIATNSSSTSVPIDILLNRYAEPGITSITPAKADLNDTVSIIGRNFTGATEVKLGGAVSPFTVVSDSLIRVIVTSAVGNKNTEVTTPSGKDTSSKFIRTGFPRIKSFSPAASSSKGSVTIVGVGFNNTSAVYFGGKPAKTFVISTDTLIYATPNVAGGSGYIKIVGKNGPDSIPGFTFINPPKISSFTPTAAGAGQAVTITGSFFTPVTRAYFGDSAAFSTQVLNDSTVIAIPGAGSSGKIYLDATTTGYDSIAGFTYLPQKTTITSFTANNPAVAGDTIFIKGQKMLALQAVTIAGYSNLDLKLLSDTTARIILGNVGSGYITAISSGGRDSVSGFYYISRPIIYSFSPRSGMVGSTVLIKGKAFNPTAASNTVFMGPVKATVTAATDSTLSIKVPTGAVLSTILVEANGLSSRSSLAFVPRFPSDTTLELTSASFSTFAGTFTASKPKKVMAADLDGDGRADLLTLNGTTGAVSIGIEPINYGTSDVTTQLFTGGKAIDMTVSDVNNDGKPDVIVCRGTNASNGDSVAVFLNKSTPRNIAFDPRSSFLSSANTFAIASDDWDADGRADIVTVGGSSGTNTAKGLRNKTLNAGPSFELQSRTFFSGGIYTAAVSRDINGDGKQDIVLLNTNSKTVTLLRNIMSFGGPVVLPIGSFYQTSFNISTDSRGLTVEDLDGDGMPDIIVTNYADSSISVYKNQSTTDSLKFATKVDFRTGVNPLAVTVVDFNGDGKPDIAVGNSSAGTISLLINKTVNGDIVLAGRKDVKTFGISYPVSLAVADVDADGRPDLLASDSTADKRFMVMNQFDRVRPSTFSPKHILHGNDTVTIRGVSFAGVTAVSFGGVNAKSFTIINDTLIKAIPGGAAMSGYVLLRTAGSKDSLAGFTTGVCPRILSFSPASGPVGSSVTIRGSDFDTAATSNIVYFGAVRAMVTTASDSVLTVIVPPGATYQPITVAVNNLVAFSAKPFLTSFSYNSNGFTAGSFIPTLEKADGGYTKATAIGDLNNDGRPDVIALIRDGKKFVVYQNGKTNDSLSFAPTPGFETGVDPDFIQVADLDGDGKLDIITGGISDANISVYRNTGSGNNIAFSARQVFPASLVSEVAINDFNGDGKTDIACMDPAAGTVILLKNISTAGNINFTRNGELSFSQLVLGGIAAGDLDGDGKPDLALSNRSTQTLIFKRNTSTADSIIFESQNGLPLMGRPGMVSIGDMNGDNKPDIVVISSDSNYVDVVLNKSVSGSISMSTGKIYRQQASNGPETLVLHDLNGDGRIDIALSNINAKSFSVFRNTGNGDSVMFAPRIDYPISNPAASAVRHIAAGDLDGDGYSDMLMTASAFNTFVFYKNTVLTPQISSLTPVNAAPGAQISIRGKNFAGISTVRISGKDRPVFTISGDTMITTTVPDTTAPGFVVVGSVYGTDSMRITPAGTIRILSFSPQNGQTGTVVTLKGKGFSFVTAVSFGGTNASSYSLLSDSVLTAVVAGGSSGLVAINTGFFRDSLAGFSFGPPPANPKLLSFTPASGKTGDTITITGKNLGAVSAVRFGGVLATSITIASDSLLKATVGAGSSGNVNVQSSTGADSLAGFNFIAPATTPKIMNFAPQSGKTGDTISINGKYLSTVSTVRFGSVAARSFSILSDSLIKAVVGTGGSGSTSVQSNTGADSLAGFSYIPPSPEIKAFKPAIGKQGDTISISGKNLSVIAAVYFGTVKANAFAVVNDSLIKAIVDTGATGKIQVSGPQGAALSDSVFSFKLHPPMISSFAPSLAFKGDIITIRGRNLKTTSQVNFNGLAATSFTVFGDTLVRAVLGTGRSGYVSIQAAGGVDSLAGFVYGSPVINITPKDSTFLFGTQISTYSRVQQYTVSAKYLEAPLQIDAPGNFEVSRAPETGFTSSLSLVNANGTIEATTIYIRYRSDSLGTNRAVITHSSAKAETKTLAVEGSSKCDAIVVLRPLINNIAADTVLCFKQTLTLNAPAGSFNIYKWSNGQTGASIVLNTSDSVTLQVGSSPACMSKPSPVVKAIRNTNTTPSLALTGDTTLVSTTAPNYRWLFNNLPLSGVTGNALTVKKVGLYAVETSNDNVCWDRSNDFPILLLYTRLVNDTIAVRSYPNPSATGSFTVVATLEHPTNVVARVTVADVNGTILLQTNKFIFFGKEVKIPVTLTVKGTVFVKLDINGDIKTQTVILQ